MMPSSIRQIPNESGHATLGTASILFQHYHPEATRIRFETRRRGSLVATRDPSTGLITLDLPRASLVTLEGGHRRRERILQQVEKIVPREQVLRIDWADEIASCVVEFSTDIDLEALAFDPFILVRTRSWVDCSTMRLTGAK